MRNIMLLAISLAAASGFARTSTSAAEPAADSAARPKIPVILDTDIGDDIDDTWALALLLKCPKSTSSWSCRTEATRSTGRRSSPSCSRSPGARTCRWAWGLARGTRRRASPWVEDYDLARYPGKVHQDGVGALIDTIMNAPQPVTLICIGPVPNIRGPGTSAGNRQAGRFVGMHGSVRKGYDGGPEPHPEWNVVADAKAAQACSPPPGRCESRRWTPAASYV